MRTSGILMHISSLPGPFGIGTLGANAYSFVDFLRESGQSHWQILPICPTGFGDSPYQSFSTFAGNPYFIDFDVLSEQGILEKRDYKNISWGNNEKSVDYGELFKNRKKVFERIFAGFSPSAEYKKFCSSNAGWLDDYALFSAIKDENSGASMYHWENDIRQREESALEYWHEKCRAKIKLYKILQFLFFEQWNRLKKYANDNSIKIIGDLPIYVAADSADVWANPKIFKLDRDFLPVEVAGCPPDDFSADGQLWGNPVYDWKRLKDEDYSWWIKRLRHSIKIYDTVRIDHFRGFDAYYCVKYGSANAKCGIWRKGPGMNFFKSVRKHLGDIPLIAEDLGFMTDSVKKLLRKSGFPGMKILQFAFDSDWNSDYLPHNYSNNSVAYTGTHDNPTIIGWFENLDDGTRRNVIEYLNLHRDDQIGTEMMRAVMASVSDTVILTMQDIIGLSDEARMNTPATVGGNWRWRAEKSDFSTELSNRLFNMTEIYGRLPNGVEKK